MRQLVSGDDDAWRRFVERFGRVVRARVGDVAHSYGKAADVSAIDDATADVFAALLANDAAALRAYAGRSSLVTYVATVATRCASRAFARALRQAIGGAQWESAEKSMGSQHFDPVAAMIGKEERTELELALRELPDKQQQIVRMFHIEGRSYADISQQMKIPIGTVGVSLRRAVERLRKTLDPDPLDSQP